jgi:hypothetical protein
MFSLTELVGNLAEGAAAARCYRVRRREVMSDVKTEYGRSWCDRLDPGAAREHLDEENVPTLSRADSTLGKGLQPLYARGAVGIAAGEGTLPPRTRGRDWPPASRPDSRQFPLADRYRDRMGLRRLSALEPSRQVVAGCRAKVDRGGRFPTSTFHWRSIAKT